MFCNTCSPRREQSQSQTVALFYYINLTLVFFVRAIKIVGEYVALKTLKQICSCQNMNPATIKVDVDDDDENRLRPIKNSFGFIIFFFIIYTFFIPDVIKL